MREIIFQRELYWKCVSLTLDAWDLACLQLRENWYTDTDTKKWYPRTSVYNNKIPKNIYQICTNCLIFEWSRNVLHPWIEVASVSDRLAIWNICVQHGNVVTQIRWGGKWVYLAYIWIVSHLSDKNYQNWWKFDEVLTKTNLLSFFGDTVYYIPIHT